MEHRLALKGQIVYAPQAGEIVSVADGYLLTENGRIVEVCDSLPEEWRTARLSDYRHCLLLPGMTDLHIHAPQYAFRGLGMDMELLPWLESYAFPEEIRYAGEDYAAYAYQTFADDLRNSFTCRANIFATVHNGASSILAALIAESGLFAHVGKVSMDRNCPPELNEGAAAPAAMAAWVLDLRERYNNVKPIITPRFIPSCSGQLLASLGQLAKQYDLPVQSHLAENLNEIEWVRKLEPQSRHYADAYDRYGLLEGQPTVMAHCVHLSKEEMRLLRKRRVFIAHCPQSNANLLSGAAPIKNMLVAGLKLGLATDMAGGAHISMLRVIQDAVAVSKMRAAFYNRPEDTLSIAEAFYLATKGGGAFFGQVGSFEPGYAADILVIDDSPLSPRGLTLRQRLERVIYQADSRHLLAKFVAGRQIAL